MRLSLSGIPCLCRVKVMNKIIDYEEEDFDSYEDFLMWKRMEDSRIEALSERKVGLKSESVESCS